MRNIAMNESTASMKDDPLTRIQREIIEVTERENEFRKVHTFARKLSDSDSELDHNSNGHTADAMAIGSPPKPMLRAQSTSYLTASTPTTTTNGNNSNGFSRRYTPNSGQKGIMQRFIASRGKLTISPMNNNVSPVSISKPVYIPPQAIGPPVVPKLPEGKAIRKGFVPVEEKIQKELKDLKNRESELRKQRKRISSYQLDFSSLDLSDKDMESESDDDIPLPGKLRVAKSIGELYEALGDRTPSPQQSGPESCGSLKPAKSLAELCQLEPHEQALAPSSTKLIAKWESLIQQKQESSAA